MKKFVLGLVVAGLWLPMSAIAQSSAATARADEPASVRAFRAISEGMVQGMNVSFTGDTDIDFVKGMIPHHQGAIAMAQVALQQGKDEKVKALARKIIATREAEIAAMREWLAARGL